MQQRTDAGYGLKRLGQPQDRLDRRAGSFDWVVDCLMESPVSRIDTPATVKVSESTGDPRSRIAPALAEIASLFRSEYEPIVELVADFPVFAGLCRQHGVAEYWAFGLAKTELSTWAARFPEYAFCVGRLRDLAEMRREHFGLAVGPVSEPCGLATPAAYRHLARLLKPAGRFVLYKYQSKSVEASRHFRTNLTRCALHIQRRRSLDGAVEVIIGRRRACPENARAIGMS